MAIFTAPALDRLIESDNTRYMSLARNSSTANPRVGNSIDGNSTKLESRVRGVSVPPKRLPVNPKRESKVDIPTTRRHERVHSLPSTPDLERGAALPLNGKLERRIPVRYKTNGSSTSAVTVVERKDHWTDISPALYATPKSTPLPDPPCSLSPSPYIINHKRRGPRLMKSFSEEDVSSFKQSTDVINSEENVNVQFAAKDGYSKPVEALDCSTNGTNDKEAGTSEQNGKIKSVENDLAQDSDVEDFVDPNDSASVRSISESECYTGADRNLNSTTPITEFFDAWEELSSESGSQLSTPRTGDELHGMRMSLLMEIEKRKHAEETLNNMTNQWRRIRDQLFDVGLRLPEAPTSYPPDEQPADICQQVFVSRFVCESIGRGLARAEVEMETEAQISTKNIEIARLCDKLHYYETVNREMSQRNQEIVETTRQVRQRRKRRHKWIWSSITIATVALVTTALAHSYFQTGRSVSSSTYESSAPDKKPLME